MSVSAMHSLALIRSAGLANLRATARHAARVSTSASIVALSRAASIRFPSSSYSTSSAAPNLSPANTSTDANTNTNSNTDVNDIDLDASFSAGTPISGSDLAFLIRTGRTGVGKDVLLIDVRNPDEHAATGLIPTAVPLPLPELQAALQEPNMQFQLLNGFPKPSREATNLVMYCKAGVRADMAAQVARALGFKRVRSYKGSWIEWSSKYANVVPEGQGASGSSSS